ncbi:zinc-dependent metalloprotease [Halosquirtibacter laminarini]|uniref:Zinc-dependent metalloprotease n=1 Tax=Halosquirtibacter laminarini TaxID=3374600 RepID=A0AC61NGT7_9BACT|nr:zinc-dependent metalloprotease [Prolixibacteraceae bacterium]
MKNFTFLVFLIAISLVTTAQPKKKSHCSNSDQYRAFMEHLAKDPGLSKKVEQSMFDGKKTLKLDLDADRKYVIPIVFHVIHDYGVENISDEKIMEALSIINKDYAAINEDMNQIVDRFNGSVGIPNIEFRLAKVDPLGNYTTGITRDVSPLTINGSWDHPEVKRINSWPHEKYLNIWIVRSSDGGNGSAWAYLPYQTDNEQYADLDGIIISSWAFGATTEGYHRILTHEIGHFLNLYHTWSPWLSCGETSACNEDDEVADTPNCTGYYGGCELDHHSCGSLDMIQNYMDYAKCPIAFTKGQVERMHHALHSKVSHRNNLWSKENIQNVLYPKHALVDLEGQNFNESSTNTGSFSTTITAKIIGDEFTSDPWNSSNITFKNLPQGLVPETKKIDENHFEISLSGKAIKHSSEDNITIEVEIKREALISNTTEKCGFGIPIVFRDPYRMIHNKLSISVDENNPWEYFTLKNTSNSYGLWYEKGKLRLETYKKNILCESQSENITPLNLGVLINEVSETWNEGGNYPNEHNFITSQYRSWEGKTAFLGFFVTNEMNENLYGWMKVSINNAGTQAELIEYALNTDPTKGIRAGQIDSQLPVYSQDTNTFEEDRDLNNGTVSTKASITFLSKYDIGSDRVLQPTTDYEISDVPTGLTSKIEVIDGNIWIQWMGTAIKHEKKDNRDITIQLKSNTFVGEESYTEEIVYHMNFIDPYRIITGELTDILVDSSNKWKWFNLFEEGPAYGNWMYKQSHIKLETYNKACITEQDSRNIQRLNRGEVVSEDRNWQKPGEYPDQLDIYHASYTKWGNTEGYIGIKFYLKDQLHYGWLKGKMEGYGERFHLVAYGYNEKPNAPIYAGEGETTLPLEVDIVADNYHIEEGNSVQFSLNSNQVVNSCNWTFEGGSPYTYSGTTPPRVTYNHKGVFNVTADIISGDQNSTVSKNDMVTVTKKVVNDYCIPKVEPKYLGLKIINVSVNNQTFDVNREGYIMSSNDFYFNRNETNIVYVDITPKWEGTYVKVWIDWNGDNKFTDEELACYMQGTTSAYGGAINIPTDAVPQTHMRCMLYYGNKDKKACDPITYQGMVVDYTVVIDNDKISTNIDQNNSEKDVIYPNPTKESFTVHLKGSSTITICNIEGITMKQVRLSKGLRQVSVRDLTPGVYFVKIKSGNTITKHRIIIQ